MNQELEDLKGDIQSLIDASAATITTLVDEMAKRAAVPQIVGGNASDGSEFTSQIEQLRLKVRTATDNMKDQAAVALASLNVAPPAAAPIVSGGTDSNAVPGATAVGPDSFKSGS